MCWYTHLSKADTRILIICQINTLYMYIFIYDYSIVENVHQNVKVWARLNGTPAEKEIIMLWLRLNGRSPSCGTCAVCYLEILF